MRFKIRNFGKITEADIKLDGITVICGNNNTGKSTVGKALFSFYNSLNNYKNKIDFQKDTMLRRVIRNYSNFFRNSKSIQINTIEYISQHETPFTIQEMKNYLNNICDMTPPNDIIKQLVHYLNTSEVDILNEYVYRYITNVMNGQINNIYTNTSNSCSITGLFKKYKNTITIEDNYCNCNLYKPIEHSAYYINTPFSLDNLNEESTPTFKFNPMARNVIDAIQQAQSAINEDSMTNILDSVNNKKDLEIVKEVIKKAYSGDTIIDHGRYYYTENGISIDFRNISAGLKSFALIERMLETGVLKKKDVLILDEPEIHLHTEWQIIYAELIVILQKTFDLTILLVTHSFQFLESLNYYMKYYGIEEKGNFYIPEQTKEGFVIKYNDNNLEDVKNNLSTGTFKIADLEFEYDMEQENGNE